MSDPPRPAGDQGGAPIDRDERKERVLHTRVPESLDRQLRHRARSLGMSVSTVVRHVLLNTFGLVEDIVTDTANVALAIAGDDAEPAAGERTPRGREIPTPGGAPAPKALRAAGVGDAADVLGWQEAVLNLNAVCRRCNAVLRRGARAAIGVRERPGPPAIVCTRCLGQLAAETGDRRGRVRRRRAPAARTRARERARSADTARNGGPRHAPGRR